MALRKAGMSYSALRAATRLPPVERPEERPEDRPHEPPLEDRGGAPSDPPLLAAAPEAPVRAERAGEGGPPSIAPGPSPEAPRDKPVYYRLRVPHPAPGVCAEFDEITRAYDAEAAIQTVFKRAFDAWTEGFGPGTLARLDFDYPRGTGSFATSRIIRPEIVAAMTRAIDPMGIRSKTFIAERIALAAMKAYFASRPRG